MRRTLLVCGLLSSLLYAAMCVFVARQWEDYSSISQTVSELSAIDAPTRGIWVPLGCVYALLTIAFGWGVFRSAGQSRALRVAGGLLVAYGVVCATWPPMHLREVLAAGGATLTDTMHLVYAAAAVLLMLLAMGFGAAGLGRRFGLYSIATMVLLALFGGLTSLEAPGVDAGLPTPWIGLWERINIGVFLLWVVVLATTLLRTPTSLDSRASARRSWALLSPLNQK